MFEVGEKSTAARRAERSHLHLLQPRSCDELVAAADVQAGVSNIAIAANDFELRAGSTSHKLVNYDGVGLTLWLLPRAPRQLLRRGRHRR